MKTRNIIFAIFTSIILASCASAPKEISEDLTYPEIIQLGQTEFDGGRYKNALIYFETAIDRYGNDVTHYVESKYEIGHLYMRQKRYEEAEPILNEIIEIYRNSTPGTIPGAYQKLAELELAKIPSKDKESKK